MDMSPVHFFWELVGFALAHTRWLKPAAPKRGNEISENWWVLGAAILMVVAIGVLVQLLR